MAAATPILERQTSQKTAAMSDDELHNAQISENYKRLLDPEFRRENVRNEGAAAPAVNQQNYAAATEILRPSAPVRQAAPAQSEYIAPVQQEYVAPAQAMPAPQAQQRPYLVTNARADSDLFRADSPINQRYAATAATAVVEEDENEDLRPTQTTIQYKTARENDVIEPKIIRESETHLLGKREKAIIATFISVVAALFILVIINSAVIAGLNSEVGLIQDSVAAAQQILEQVNSQISASTSLERIAEYALSHGLILP